MISFLETTFEASKNPAAARSLARLISDISERCCSAGWLDGNEFDIWAVIHGERTSHGYPSETEIRDLFELYDLCGGWVIWRKGDLGASFVSTAEWTAMERP